MHVVQLQQGPESLAKEKKLHRSASTHMRTVHEQRMQCMWLLGADGECQGWPVTWSDTRRTSYLL